MQQVSLLSAVKCRVALTPCAVAPVAQPRFTLRRSSQLLAAGLGAPQTHPAKGQKSGGLPWAVREPLGRGARGEEWKREGLTLTVEVSRCA